MIEGVRESAIVAGLIADDTFDQGISDLYRTAQVGGTFCYTFFKAFGVKQRLPSRRLQQDGLQPSASASR
jgi:hypothetical protein